MNGRKGYSELDYRTQALMAAKDFNYGDDVIKQIEHETLYVKTVRIRTVLGGIFTRSKHGVQCAGCQPSHRDYTGGTRRKRLRFRTWEYPCGVHANQRW